MKSVTLVVCLLAISAFAHAEERIVEEKPEPEPAALVEARKAYEAEVKIAVDPIKASYVKNLEEVKKEYLAKEDLISVQAVQMEINRLISKVAGTLVGRWDWKGFGEVTEFKKDGTANSSAGPTAKWRCLDEKTRKYEIRWSTGFIDWAVMSSDGLTLYLKNSIGSTFTHQKLAEQQ